MPGWWSRRHEEDMDDQLAVACLETFERKSERVSLNRWMAVLRSAADFQRFWHRRLVAYLQ
eukprot:1030557-Lingulodinium_polyedra.AAC.1